jgi:hypothetical protein
VALGDRDGAVPHDGGVLVRDAAELVAIDVFNAAQAANEPVTGDLVKRIVGELLAHPQDCACGRCEAAAIARAGHVWRIAAAWQGATAATRRRAHC